MERTKNIGAIPPGNWLRVQCETCDRLRWFSADEAAKLFSPKATLDQLSQRFVCTTCGSRQAKVSVIDPRPQSFFP